MYWVRINEYFHKFFSLNNGKKQAKIIITNDPDHGRLEDYRKVFSLLKKLDIKITTSVFCKIENDGSDLSNHCYENETHSLENPAYNEFMQELYEDGHEIAFHGYSQISNTRERFIEGLEIFKSTFGDYPYTYIEHGGNPKKHPIGMCKKETLAVDGMNPQSDHYIWDIIKEKVNCIWAWHDLLDDDYYVKQDEDYFYKHDSMLCFKRYRMHYINYLLHRTKAKSGTFLGYTHFGYDGYQKTNRYNLENWIGVSLRNAEISLLDLIENNYHFVTLRALAESLRMRKIK